MNGSATDTSWATKCLHIKSTSNYQSINQNLLSKLILTLLVQINRISIKSKGKVACCVDQNSLSVESANTTWCIGCRHASNCDIFWLVIFV